MITVPEAVQDEVLLALLLAPLLPAGLDRPFLPEIYSTDAAPSFGLGVTKARCTRKQVRDVCRHSHRHGCFMHPPDLLPGGPKKQRAGTGYKLPKRAKAFRVMISAKARWTGHATALEAHGLLLAVKCIASRRTKHSSRVCILVDSQATLGAASKGRSSSNMLRRTIRNMAAHLLAADLLLKLFYTPSECNTADPPSRSQM